MSDIAALTASCSYDAPAKVSFHRVARKYLRKLAQALGLAPDSYDIRSNKAGIAVSGEVTLHGESIYVQVSQGMMGPTGDRMVLYRLCRGRQDYTGMVNHFASASDLVAVTPLANCIRVCQRPTDYIPAAMGGAA